MKRFPALPALVLLSLLTMGAASGTSDREENPREPMSWKVDASHTEINFSVKHFFTPVTGTFRSFDIELMFDAEAPENSSVKVDIDVASIDTNNERRDNHLRSEDFFNAGRFPKMTFQSTAVRESGPGQLVATGKLTIKETSREVDLAINVLGVRDLPSEMQEMMGGITRVAGFQGSTTIDRREFEVGVANWAQTVIVGGEVEISVALEANHM